MTAGHLGQLVVHTPDRVFAFLKNGKRIEHGTIHAEARRRHRGRTTWVWDVELTDDEGRLAALSRVTIAVRDR